MASKAVKGRLLMNLKKPKNILTFNVFLAKKILVESLLRYRTTLGSCSSAVHNIQQSQSVFVRQKQKKNRKVSEKFIVTFTCQAHMKCSNDSSVSWQLVYTKFKLLPKLF